MNQRYIITPIESGQTITEQYCFPGGTYNGLKGRNAYTEEFFQIVNMNFPQRQSKIEGSTDLDIEGLDTRYNLETEIIFEIVE